MPMETTAVAAEKLIADLLAHPGTFERRGKGNALLEHYFHGYPIETLRPLLMNPNETVRSSAVWIAAELATRAYPVVDAVVPLVKTQNSFIRYHALEVIFLNAASSEDTRVAHVFEALEDPEPFVRRSIMLLLNNATMDQLGAAGKRPELLGPSAGIHGFGITLLIRGTDVDERDLRKVVENREDALVRRYGAIAIERRWENCPGLLAYVEQMGDEDIAGFAATLRKERLRDVSRKRRSSRTRRK